MSIKDFWWYIYIYIYLEHIQHYRLRSLLLESTWTNGTKFYVQFDYIWSPEQHMADVLSNYLVYLICTLLSSISSDNVHLDGTEGYLLNLQYNKDYIKTSYQQQQAHTWLIPRSWMLSTIFLVSWPPRDVPRTVPPRLWISFTLFGVMGR